MLTDADRIAAAQAYIDALATHDADAVPFAPGCTRVEVGLKTGFSGNHLRRSLNRGMQYRVIKSVTKNGSKGWECCLGLTNCRNFFTDSVNFSSNLIP